MWNDTINHRKSCSIGILCVQVCICRPYFVTLQEKNSNAEMWTTQYFTCDIIHLIIITGRRGLVSVSVLTTWHLMVVHGTDCWCCCCCWDFLYIWSLSLLADVCLIGQVKPLTAREHLLLAVLNTVVIYTFCYCHQRYWCPSSSCCVICCFIWLLSDHST